jgi:hypothetical protein
VAHVVNKDAVPAIRQQLVATGVATGILGDNASQLEALLDILAKANGNTPTWLMPLAAHPRSEERIRNLEVYLTRQRLAGAPGVKLRASGARCAAGSAAFRAGWRSRGRGGP